MAEVRIGLSGWTYAGWRGRFYPQDLPARRELEFASKRFNSLEVNGSFYRLQRPDTYQNWYERTPADFRFAIKGSRFITHNKKLSGIEAPLANFLASGILRLNEKLGPILWQLAPTFRYRSDRLSDFFEMLPRDTESAAARAADHDHRLDGHTWLEIDRNRQMRHAIEPRHESFFVPEFAELCRRHRIAIVVSDSADWPCTEEVTAPFLYLRLHGSTATYASGYTDAEIRRWADRIRMWKRGGQPPDAKTFSGKAPPARKSRDVYVYFDNDAKVRAPADATRLMARLKD